MKRICPNCLNKSIAILPLILWSARCKVCNSKIAINQFYSFLFYILFTPALIFGAFYFHDYMSYYLVLFVMFVYFVCIVGFEIVGPLVIRERGR
ncbi:hypothetical protein DS2_15464 [Catenovulum agarivorans DS-2]|uniref:Uncharacterized protein n=1 Tax=Catenovulum agarivorans DS-2 TaxID=1328313 RepID=W7Q7M9_9ALTE|nr:hypothetical protein DS2_15464 [Catenovulum agarivorans DS-2]